MSTEANLRKGFFLGDWEILPDRSLLRDGDNEVHIEPIQMNVLLELAKHQGEVLTKDELIDSVWEGRAQSDEPLLAAISKLRRGLGDSPTEPRFIRNIPKIGYELIMPVVPKDPVVDDTRAPAPTIPVNWMLGIVIAIAVGAVAYNFSCPWFGLGCDRAPLPSVALCRFECTSNTDSYLCEGFDEELAITLWQSGTMRVGKLESYCDVETDLKELGFEQYVQGTVQRVGEDLKIDALLRESGSDDLVGPVQAMGLVDELFLLQEEIATKIHQLLVPESTASLKSASRPTNHEAWEAFLHGRAQLERRTPSDIRDSIESFRLSLMHDPNYGPAYLQLAHAYLLRSEFEDPSDIGLWYDRALETAAAGVDADPEIREVAATVDGFIHHKRRQWLDASRAFDIAASADTVYPQTHNWYSRFLGTVGRREEALQHARYAYDQKPDNRTIVSRLAITHFWQGSLQEAEKYFAIASQKLDQRSPLHHLAHAMYLVHIGDLAAARVAAKDGLLQFDEEADWVDPVFDGLEDPAQRDAAIRAIESLEAETELARYVILALWGIFGEAERAISTVNAILANEQGQDAELGLEILFSDQVLPLVSGHPELPRLLDNAGLTAYWADIGCAWANDRLNCD